MQSINFYLPTPALSGSGALRSFSFWLWVVANTYNLLLITYYLQLVTPSMGIFSACFCVWFRKQGTPIDGSKIYKNWNFCMQKRGMIKSVVIKLKPEWVIPVISSVFLTLYFFYIDEAKYSFNGIFEFTNLIFLGVYVFILVGVQKLIQLGLVYLKFSKNTSLISNNIVSAIVLLTLLFIFFIIFA
jgi:hypothetical protein